MTKKDKEILFRDLSARLPYRVKIHIDFINSISFHIVGDAILYGVIDVTNQLFDYEEFKQDFIKGDCAPISGGLYGNGKLKLGDFKPYLRKMSSMTKEEMFKLDAILSFKDRKFINIAGTPQAYDWLYENHFDFRNLIERGLALEAPKGMFI